MPKIFSYSLIALMLCICSPRGSNVAAQTPTFIDVTKEAGITWVHNNAMSPQHYLPETVGAGCVFFDYDNDGWMDIYLVNSGPSDFFTPKTLVKNALYHK